MLILFFMFFSHCCWHFGFINFGQWRISLSRGGAVVLWRSSLMYALCCRRLALISQRLTEILVNRRHSITWTQPVQTRTCRQYKPSAQSSRTMTGACNCHLVSHETNTVWFAVTATCCHMSQGCRSIGTWIVEANINSLTALKENAAKHLTYYWVV